MTRQLKIGLCGRMFPPADDALVSAQRAEALGWDFINYPDQLSGTHPTGLLQTPVAGGDPTAPNGMYSDVWYGSFEMCTAAAVLTRDIDIMLAVVDPLRRSPALMAQEMATLQHLSKGRMTFALGSGEAKQFEPYGETRTKPIGRLEESIRYFNALWQSRGEPVSRASEFWPLTNAVFPIPQFEGRDPDLLIVGGTERLLRLAGELCAGWLTFLPGGAMDDAGLLADMITDVKAVTQTSCGSSLRCSHPSARPTIKPGLWRTSLQSAGWAWSAHRSPAARRGRSGGMNTRSATSTGPKTWTSPR